MNADESVTLPRKKHGVLWWVAGFFQLLLLLFLYQLFGPNPPISISKQTTHITEPLGPDGLPDYEQFVLDISREGVTPENNAAVLLWQALFPGEVDPQFHAALAAELGLEAIPSEEEALTALSHATTEARIAAFLKKRDNSNANTGSPTDDSTLDAAEQSALAADVEMYDGLHSAVEKLVNRVKTRPWTSDQVPPVAEWVAENQVPLDLIIEASRRPRYYAPSPTLLNKDRDLLISMLLPHVQSVREAARALPARAMLSLGEGRADEAWQDILAVHRLSRLLTQGHTLVEHLVAIAMSDIACDDTVALVDHPGLTPEQARQVQRDLAALPNFAGMARCLDQTERACALDAFVRIGTGGGGELFSAVAGGGDDVGNNVFNVISVDWNIVLRDTNRWYDRLAAAARMPDRQKRETALAQIDADLQQIVVEMRTPSHLLAGVVSRQQRSRIVSGMMLGLFLPAVTAATNAEDRANTTLELTRLAAALAVHRAEHGDYPEKLDELVPRALDKLPVDLYNSSPFSYKREGQGYLLYTLGENGNDDGGSHKDNRILKGQSLDDFDEAKADELHSQIPVGADDFSIHVPRPAFELPKITTPENEP
jgi:hypothetical protein